MVSLGLGVLLYREKRKGKKDDKDRVNLECDVLGGSQINGHRQEEEGQDREAPGSPAEYCVIQREVGALPLVELDGVGEHSSDSDNVYNTLVRQE